MGINSKLHKIISEFRIGWNYVTISQDGKQNLIDIYQIIRDVTRSKTVYKIFILLTK